MDSYAHSCGLKSAFRVWYGRNCLWRWSQSMIHTLAAFSNHNLRPQTKTIVNWSMAHRVRALEIKRGWNLEKFGVLGQLSPGSGLIIPNLATACLCMLYHGRCSATGTEHRRYCCCITVEVFVCEQTHQPILVLQVCLAVWTDRLELATELMLLASIQRLEYTVGRIVL